MDYAKWLEDGISAPWAIFSVAAILFSSWAGGLAVIKAAGLKLRNPAARILLPICLGLNAWALLSLCAGSVHLIGIWTSRAALSVFAAAAVFFAILGLRHGRLPLRIPALLRINWLFLSILAILFALCLGNALCPPGGMGLDEQSYHLPIPARWNADFFPYVYADLPYSGYPSLPELIFWPLMAAGKSSAPRLLGLCVQTLSLAGLYFLLRAWARPLAAFVLAMAFQLACAHLVFQSEVFVEPYMLFDFICGLMLLRERGPGGRLPRGAAFICGLLAAGAAACKLTGAAPGAILGVGLLFRCGLSLRQMAFFCLGSAFALPFYLRAFLQTGNPFHPYYAWLFSSNEATLQMSRHYHLMGGPPFFGLEGFWNALKSPFLVSWAEGIYDGDWGLQFLLLCAFCLLAAVILLKFCKQSSLRLQALYSVVGSLALFSFWAATAQQARFLEPCVAMLLMGSALFMRSLASGRRIIAVVAIAGCAAISCPWGWTVHYVNCWRIFAAGVPPSRFLERVWNDGLYGAYSELARLAPPDAKAMILFEKRIFHCPRPCVVGSPLYQEAFFMPPPKGPAEKLGPEIIDTLRRAGVGYVVLRLDLDKVDSLPEAHGRTEAFIDAISWLVKNGSLEVLWGSRSHLLLKVRT